MKSKLTLTLNKKDSEGITFNFLTGPITVTIGDWTGEFYAIVPDFSTDDSITIEAFFGNPAREEINSIMDEIDALTNKITTLSKRLQLIGVDSTKEKLWRRTAPGRERIITRG